MVLPFAAYLEKRFYLTPVQTTALLENLPVKFYAKGEIILHAGASRSETYFVNSGVLRSYALDKKGKEHIIQFAPEHWLLNERNSSMFDDPSPFFIDAIEDTEVTVLPPNFFNTLQKLSGKVAEENTLMLHNTIRVMQKRIGLLLSATAEERYLDFLQMYPSLSRRIPQWMIASYLGITPESLSRVRKEMVRKN